MQKLLGTKRTSSRTASAIIHVPKEVERAFGALDSAKMRLEQFRKENERVIAQVDKLRAAVEAAREDAKTAYFTHKETLGPQFHEFQISRRRRVDALELLSLQPEMIELVEFSMTMKVFDELVASGVISAEVAEKVESYTENVTSSSK